MVNWTQILFTKKIAIFLGLFLSLLVGFQLVTAFDVVPTASAACKPIDRIQGKCKDNDNNNNNKKNNNNNKKNNNNNNNNNNKKNNNDNKKDKNNGGTEERSGSDEGQDDPLYTEAVDTQSCTTARGIKGAKTEIGCIPKDPAGFAAEYYTYGLSLIGGLSLLFLIFGGYILLTSSGDPLRIRNGKTYIFYALFGLLLAIFGFVFIEVIAVDILHLPGFGR